MLCRPISSILSLYVLLLHSQVEGGSAFGRLAAACSAAAHQIHRAAALLDPVLEAHPSQVLLPRVAMMLRRRCRCAVGRTSTLHLPYRMLAVSLVSPLRLLRTAEIACDDLAAGC